MEDKKIKVRIKPLHNIGGIGMSGDVVWMDEKEAASWIEDGYVEIVGDEAPPQRPSTASGVPLSAPRESIGTSQDGDAATDHAIMKKPRSKRHK